MVYRSLGYLWSLDYPWGPGFKGSNQHTLVNDLVEKFFFGGEGIVLEEYGPHLAMMGCQMVFVMVVDLICWYGAPEHLELVLLHMIF